MSDKPFVSTLAVPRTPTYSSTPQSTTPESSIINGRRPSPLTPPLTPAHALTASSKLSDENLSTNMDDHTSPKPQTQQQQDYVPRTPLTPRQDTATIPLISTSASASDFFTTSPSHDSQLASFESRSSVMMENGNVEGNLDATQVPGRFLFLYVGSGHSEDHGRRQVGTTTPRKWNTEKMKEEFGRK